MTTFGSSPLARGTRLGHRLEAARVRLIPARAGNTGQTSPQDGGTAAHPRSRGEHYYSPVTYTWPDGSSPLARGTLSGFLSWFNNTRLIPARAGNTTARLGCS